MVFGFLPPLFLRTVDQREERHRHEEGHDGRLLCVVGVVIVYMCRSRSSRWDDGDGRATCNATNGGCVCVLTPDPPDPPTDQPINQPNAIPHTQPHTFTQPTNQPINQSPTQDHTQQNARAPSSSLGPTGSGGASPGGMPRSGPGRSRPGGRRRRRGGSSVVGVGVVICGWIWCAVSVGWLCGCWWVVWLMLWYAVESGLKCAGRPHGPTPPPSQAIPPSPHNTQTNKHQKQRSRPANSRACRPG